jgi:hypothetical protein
MRKVDNGLGNNRFAHNSIPLFGKKMVIIGVTVATTRSIGGSKRMPFAFWLAFWAF